MPVERDAPPECASPNTARRAENSPAIRRATLAHKAGQGAQRLVPQVPDPAPSFGLGQVRRKEIRVSLRFRPAQPTPSMVDVCLGVGHGERPGGQAETGHIGHGQPVRAGDAHGAQLGVQAGGKGIAQGEDAPTDPPLNLQHLGLVAGPQELVGGDEAGQPCTDDEHALRSDRPRLQPLADEGEVGGDRRLLVQPGAWRHVTGNP